MRSLGDLASSVSALHEELLRATADPRLEGIAPANRASAENLVQYLALRRHDLRELQSALAARGLSSLGRAEAGTLGSVESILGMLAAATGAEPPESAGAIDAAGARELLAERARALLGAPRPGREVRIMVTLPTGTDRTLAAELVAAGMDVARINCGRDDPEVWSAMAAAIREAGHDAAQPCRIVMELSGPKLRVGAIAPGPQVLRLRPSRDEYGRVVAPVRAWLTSTEAPSLPPAPVALLPVPAAWLERVHDGTVVRLRDTRDSQRTIEIGPAGLGGRWCSVWDTTYLATGTTLVADGPAGSAQVGWLPPLEGRIRLNLGDRLVLGADPAPGRSASASEPARVPCTLPAVLAALEPGRRVMLDDGRFECRVLEAGRGEALLEIEHAPAGGGWLREERGINFPDTPLELAALTARDREVIPLVAELADACGLSFVTAPADVLNARRALDDAGGTGVGLILKIETEAAFRGLPDMLLAAMRSDAPVGVMIARGDLAVEAGYERLAELQEEILWICEAANVPAIWATEVLDRLAKTGRPSRAEITDAAMAERAECVMLNKGPRIVEAVGVLDDILRRMTDHQRKKFSLLRPLRSFAGADA